MAKKTYNKTCKWCEKKFVANRKDKTFCQNKHKLYHFRFYKLINEISPNIVNGDWWKTEAIRNKIKKINFLTDPDKNIGEEHKLVWGGIQLLMKDKIMKESQDLINESKT